MEELAATAPGSGVLLGMPEHQPGGASSCPVTSLQVFSSWISPENSVHPPSPSVGGNTE